MVLIKNCFNSKRKDHWVWSKLGIAELSSKVGSAVLLVRCVHYSILIPFSKQCNGKFETSKSCSKLLSVSLWRLKFILSLQLTCEVDKSLKQFTGNWAISRGRVGKIYKLCALLKVIFILIFLNNFFALHDSFNAYKNTVFCLVLVCTYWYETIHKICFHDSHLSVFRNCWGSSNEYPDNLHHFKTIFKIRISQSQITNIYVESSRKSGDENLRAGLRLHKFTWSRSREKIHWEKSYQ